VKRLLYYEEFSDPLSAIAGEKQLKLWNKGKKLALVRFLSPMFRDLSKTWKIEPSTPAPQVSECNPENGARSLHYGDLRSG
jgi:hypothetical protein